MAWLKKQLKNHRIEKQKYYHYFVSCFTVNHNDFGIYTAEIRMFNKIESVDDINAIANVIKDNNNFEKVAIISYTRLKR